ncbi:MAG TPA: HepT-like ribonuclease domain-containing protein [Candidatus Thermoplasmatota archaeon]|nr:HepT-like ribonuclease domain-containing protein [Candidatus Thermoplasmatota archaeon]
MQDILDVAAELAAHLEGRTKADFLKDRGVQRIAERLVEIAGEAANNVSEEVAETIAANWRGLRAMRILLAHAYRRIDLEILWNAASKDLPRLAASVAAHIE